MGRSKGCPWVMVAVALLVAGAVVAEEIPWGGEDKPAPRVPACFRGRAADRLAAEEVARQDAYRKLIERIYSLSLDARTDVYDLVLDSRVIKTAVSHRLKGVKDVDKRYYDDCRVEIAVKVTVREVLETIEKTYKEVKKGRRLVSRETIEDVKRKNRDKDIIAVGRGALKGSEGLEKIRAMRAAEVDCYERIARRVFGLELAADTTVRDFVLESDAILTKVSATLRGVKFVNYDFFDDGTCAATGQIKIREVVEVLTRTYRRYAKGSKVKIEDIENIERKNRDRTIVEVGQGTVRTAPAPEPEPFFEEKTIFEKVIKERVIRREIGVVE